jgi:hypothetical protein
VSGGCTDGVCVAVESCLDLIQNQDETDVDCGGSICASCALEKSCSIASDCSNGNCVDGLCTAIPTCVDGLQNQDETDVDCGGSICGSCDVGGSCSIGSDCSSNDCTEGVCVTCDLTNAYWSEVDVVNGTLVHMRVEGDNCAGESIYFSIWEDDLLDDEFVVTVNDVYDRSSWVSLYQNDGIGDPEFYFEAALVSDAGVSVNSKDEGNPLLEVGLVPDCTDGVQNQDETDVDCGGSICGDCAFGKVCSIASDCVSDTCSGGVCIAAPNCTDSVKNQDETDIDCGGLICGDCNIGGACLIASDCSSANCVGDVCVAIEACTDLIKNQDETDVDCGGLICGDCNIGGACLIASDCSSANCVGDVCVAIEACTDLIKNQDETDIDCGGFICGSCDIGWSCLIASDCVNDTCTDGVCVAAEPSINDTVLIPVPDENDTVEIPDTVILNPGEEKDIILKFSAPSGEGTYEGVVTLSGGGFEEELPFTVEVLNGNDAINITLGILDSQLRMGDMLITNLSVYPIIENDVDAVLKYFILDSEDFQVYETQEDVKIKDVVSFYREFALNNFSSGNYLMVSELVYTEGYSEDEDDFSILEELWFWWFYLILLIMIILLILFFILRRREKEKEEKDGKNSGFNRYFKNYIKPKRHKNYKKRKKA